MTGALRSGASTTRKPLGSVMRSTGYLVAGIRTALRTDTPATVTGRRPVRSAHRPHRVQDHVDDPVIVVVSTRDGDVQNRRTRPPDVDECQANQLVGRLEPRLVEAHPELRDPGRPAAERCLLVA